MIGLFKGLCASSALKSLVFEGVHLHLKDLAQVKAVSVVDDVHVDVKAALYLQYHKSKLCIF